MQHSNNLDDNNFDNDDLVTFQLDSQTISFFYSQFTKYSKHIRDEYLFSDVTNHFPHEFHQFQRQHKLSSDTILLFFQLLQQNYNFNKNFTITYMQCLELLKISKYLETRKLTFQIKQYIQHQNNDTDFIIQMILCDSKQTKKSEIEINQEMEDLLISKIDECLSNDKFAELPISVIYRVVEGSHLNGTTSDKLFEFIKKSVNKLCILFQFVELGKLSEDKLEELCELYLMADEVSNKCFSYLRCDLSLIKKLIFNKRNLHEELKSSEDRNSQQRSQIEESERIKKEQQIQMQKFETQIDELKKQLAASRDEKDKLQEKMKESEMEKDKLQEKMKESEMEKDKLREELENVLFIKGNIAAHVKNGALIGAQISLEMANSLDSRRSKYIISESNAKKLGEEAYKEGEPITSLNMDTNYFLRRSGTYYMRCIVFDINGGSRELVSSPITTSGTFATFDYEGKPARVSLCKGRYKLEVWGAKGGNSAGNSSASQGGLGGYSRGILSLRERETVHIFVGCEGKPASSTEGETTNGGFPDGGGTKTGHYQGNASPGTGGGSTSIRIRGDTDYSRVIVAGGGGGASGSRRRTNCGGFGGGLSGGNCYYKGSQISEGSGTQTGSTGCTGGYSSGDPGIFGHGANGKYNLSYDSGGGGGGGWYGGGGGGSGNNAGPSSGGGGSGWTFTASNFNAFQTGDASNAKKFVLDSSFHLTEALTIEGSKEFPRPDGNGNERGHPGNGYAKITIL